ncbi:MAG: hypothetical protein K0R55_3458 [Sporomusa sp.]|nr:hypothetical protein [Sporomusa sp.]
MYLCFILQNKFWSTINNRCLNTDIIVEVFTGRGRRISTTPTDILHLLDECRIWSCEAAERGGRKETEGRFFCFPEDA